MSRRDFYARQESESIRLLDGTNSDDDDLRDNPFPDSPSLRKARKRGGALDAFLSRMGGSLAVIYFLVMAVNGALIGALGPSLEPIGRACRMNDAELGQLILQNRICKFVGNLIWCAYANRLQHPDGGVGRPHSVFAGLMLLSASSAITLGAGEQKMAVQVALLSWGIAYGITDAGVTSLTVWRWAHDNRRRRIHVAVLNAGFTVGALIGPGLVALSLRYGGGRWAFFFIAAAAFCACALLGWQPGVLLPVTQRSSGMGQGSGSRIDSDLAGYPPRFNGADKRLRYESLFTIAMSIVVYCITSTEHGMATWLSPFGTSRAHRRFELPAASPRLQTNALTLSTPCLSFSLASPSVSPLLLRLLSPAFARRHRGGRSGGAAYGGDVRRVLGGHVRWPHPVGRLVWLGIFHVADALLRPGVVCGRHLHPDAEPSFRGAHRGWLV